MQVEILQKQHGGTQFYARPHRLHLGAQNAAGVDELQFTLPAAWAGCTVALYLRRADGTLLAPVTLDTEHRVTVDRRLTGSTGGQWMLAALAEGYTAYTQPGSYDTYAILPTDGGAEELPPSQYEQFVARVLESASNAATAAQRAAASAASTSANAAQAQNAAQRTSTDSAAAARCAARAEAAAARAEELAPADGLVVSVNGKSSIVSLSAQEVGAVPAPANPAAGSLLRVLSVDPDTGALLTDTTPPPDLSPYVRSSTVPTAEQPGAVRVDPACGIGVRADGTLTTAPPTTAVLDAMADAYAPLTPALLPRGVKKALTTAASAAEWTADEKAAALRTLGADFSAYYTKSDINTLLAAPSLNAYPVGSIYQTTSSASPAALFGGTWERIAADRVLVGAGSSYPVGSAGGTAWHNLTSDELPATLTVRYAERYNASGQMCFAPLVYGAGFPTTVNTFTTGWAGAAFSTVQPYFAVYIWRRVA